MKYVFIQPDMRVANWRTVWPAKELRRRGYDVDIYAMGTAKPQLEDTEGEVTFVLHFVNKAWNLDGYPVTVADLASQALEYGRLFLSFDDDWSRLLDIEPTPYNPLAVRVAQQIAPLTMLADRVIVATPRLAEVYGQWHPDVRVARNYLPSSVLDLSRHERRDVVAWMGIMPVHGMDWNLLQPYAKDLPPLRLIGPGKWAADKIRSWGARHVEWTDPTLDQRHLYRMIGAARAAIIPLADTPFNRGKSWIKPMEFIARGVQPVSSWHPEYEALDGLTGVAPTFTDPADLVRASVEAFERGSADDLPDRLRDARLLLEERGGEEWEAALEH